MGITEKLINENMELAFSRLNKAYAPYSNFCVSAVLVTTDGRQFTGTNIENVSFGATICAERVAIVNAVNEGYRKESFLALFIIAKTNKPIAPCCLCRQVFVEFFDEQMPIFLGNMEKQIKQVMVKDLIPYAFDSLEM
ncbi:MAG: cytidine deaminase [Culicoidibacterales bacterium]